MSKIKKDFILNQYKSGIKNYSDFTKEVGLWESEKYVFKKHLVLTDKILDLGCGTGRTTFPLYKLGFNNIIGVDLTPEMIYEAEKLNAFYKLNIDFRIGDATQLEFEDSSFDSLIFSFNGLMSIPNQKTRDKALTEIKRVIKKGGIFIFTTHDRKQEEIFFEFWKEEKQRWKEGLQNQKLYDFGDIIAYSKNEKREIFIHIPNEEEISTWLSKWQFKTLETFYRSEKFEESILVKTKSGECRFWIAESL